MHSSDDERAAPAAAASYCIDTAGWLSPARHCPSPNYNERPAGCVVDLLVVHNISLPPGQFGGGYVEALFTNRLDCAADPGFAELAGLEVSAHLLIDRAGIVTQFVGFDQRAWHAGKSRFDGRENCNDFSIGIELEGTDAQPYTYVQYTVLTTVVGALLRRYPALAPRRIVGHSDIAPGRKTDPGPAFDWTRLRGMLDARMPGASNAGCDQAPESS